MGTCGKIGISWENWVRLGGYDESMLAMGCQDVDLLRRMNLVGVVEHVSKNDGFTVSNRQEEFEGLLASDGKSRRKAKLDENKAKLKYLPDHEKKLGFAAICRHNGAIMHARLDKNLAGERRGGDRGAYLSMCAQPTHHIPR